MFNEYKRLHITLQFWCIFTIYFTFCMILILTSMILLDTLEYQYNNDTLWNTILVITVLLEIFYNANILKLFEDNNVYSN